MVLSHQAGLPWTTKRYPKAKRFDWETLTTALAEQVPIWEPGTRVEYHGGTFGYLVGNVVERIDGRSLSTFFHEEIAAPLGADFLISFGPEHDHRCAEMVGPANMVGGSNTRVWRAAGDGAATGSGSAEGLARVYAALAGGGMLDGVRLLGTETIDAAVEEQPLSRANGAAGDFGLGYQLFWKVFPGMNEFTFGHTGMGGSVGLADRKRGLGMGYVMNQMNSGGAAPLVNTTYAALIA
jgi:CubicO group peptidase (beta-lactamase class C family)